MSIQFHSCLYSCISLDTKATTEAHVTSEGRWSGICDFSIKHSQQMNYLLLGCKLDCKYDNFSWQQFQHSTGTAYYHDLEHDIIACKASWRRGGLKRFWISLLYN